jgi:hypothetical protein
MNSMFIIMTNGSEMLLVNKYQNNITFDEYNQSLNQINALNIIQLLTYNRLLRQDEIS